MSPRLSFRSHLRASLVTTHTKLRDRDHLHGINLAADEQKQPRAALDEELKVAPARLPNGSEGGRINTEPRRALGGAAWIRHGALGREEGSGLAQLLKLVLEKDMTQAARARTLRLVLPRPDQALIEPREARERSCGRAQEDLGADRPEILKTTRARRRCLEEPLDGPHQIPCAVPSCTEPCQEEGGSLGLHVKGNRVGVLRRADAGCRPGEAVVEQRARPIGCIEPGSRIRHQQRRVSLGWPEGVVLHFLIRIRCPPSWKAGGQGGRRTHQGSVVARILVTARHGLSLVTGRR